MKYMIERRSEYE